MNNNGYIPGLGYGEGYSDRMSGFANRSAGHPVSEPFWSEYAQGYAEAERKVIEAAKQGIVEGKTFLSEGNNPTNF